MRSYLFLGAFFEGGRTFAGATSAAYLASIGMPLSSIARLKLIQAGTMLLADFPTGVVADHWGRRLSLCLSAVLGAIAFSLYFCGQSFILFCLAEICLGLCLSFWSGAFEAYVIDRLKMAGDKKTLNAFFHSAASYNSFGVIFSGVLGGFVANYSLRIPFLLCAVALGILFVLLRVAFKIDVPASAIRVKHQTLKDVKSALGNSTLQPYIAGLVMLMFIMQPIIYYWQPWFLELARVLSSERVGSILGFVFLCFQSVILLTSMAYARLNSSGRLLTDTAIPVLFLVLGLSTAMTVRVESIGASVSFFCGAEAALVILSSLFKAKINERLSSGSRASVLSAIGVIARSGTMFGLLIIGASLGSVPSGLDSLRGLFIHVGHLGVISGVVVCLRLFLGILGLIKFDRQSVR